MARELDSLLHDPLKFILIVSVPIRRSPMQSRTGSLIVFNLLLASMTWICDSLSALQLHQLSPSNHIVTSECYYDAWIGKKEGVPWAIRSDHYKMEVFTFYLKIMTVILSKVSLKDNEWPFQKKKKIMSGLYVTL